VPPPKSRPYADVSWATRFSSTTPAAAKRAASATISSIGLERASPRIAGMAQNAHLREQPSAIFTYADAAPGSRKRGVPWRCR
jgi:hypothetical protein